MAYSRWSYSHWYTYWSIDSPDEKIMQNLVIEGEHCFVFTYGQLKNNFDTCIAEISSKEDVASEVIEELKLYIYRFLYDVDAEFGWRI